MRRLIVCCCFLWLWPAATCHAAGEWFVFTDRNDYWTSNRDHGAAKTLAKLAATNRELKSVCFTPEGDWVILTGLNGVHTNNPKLPAVKKLQEFQKGHTLNCVAFTPTGSWVVFWDRSSWWYSNGVPQDAINRITELAKGGNYLRSITFLPNGGWVLLVNDGVYYSHPPADLEKELGNALKDGIPVRCVASTTFGDWFVITDKGWSASNVKHPAAKSLAKLSKESRSLKWVAVAPQDPTKTRFRLEVKPAQRVVAVLTVDITHPNSDKIDESVIFAPQAPNLPGQKDVRTTFSPHGTIVREDGPLKRPLFLARVSDGRKTLHIVLTTEATLMSRKLLPLAEGQAAPKVADLSAEEVKWYTRFSEDGVLEPNPKPFREWLGKAGLKRETGEGDLAFAYRAFEYLKHHFRYEFPTGDRSLAAVCASGRSDCAGLSAVFIGVLRDNGVPARALTGRMAVSGDESHVRAEFFARGVGWVPVDTAAAVSDGGGSAFAFFGNDPGDLLVLSHDPTGSVDTFVVGKRASVARQGIGYWWRGTGKDEKLRQVEKWTVRKEKMVQARPK